MLVISAIKKTNVYLLEYPLKYRQYTTTHVFTRTHFVLFFLVFFSHGRYSILSGDNEILVIFIVVCLLFYCIYFNSIMVLMGFDLVKRRLSENKDCNINEGVGDG